MFNKFESVCESILESNKGDMEQLRDSMKEAFGLKDQNFSAVNILPDNTARMQFIVPENKQFTDEVSIIDAKNGKFLINSLKLKDQKTTSVEKAIEFLTVNDGEDEKPEGEEEQGTENEETPEPEEEGEAPKPEGEEETTEAPKPEGEEEIVVDPKPEDEEEEEDEEEKKKKEGEDEQI